MIKEQVKELIRAGDAHVGVIGLGYVGLPLVVTVTIVPLVLRRKR